MILFFSLSIPAGREWAGRLCPGLGCAGWQHWLLPGAVDLKAISDLVGPSSTTLLRATQSCHLMMDESWRWLKLLPRATTTSTAGAGLSSMVWRASLKWFANMRQRGLALARHEEAKHQGTRTVTRTVPREHWHKGSCQRGVRKFQKSITYWFVLVLALCSLGFLFGFFFPPRNRTWYSFSIFILANGWLTQNTTLLLHDTPPRDPPIPLENLSNILDKPGEVGCISFNTGVVNLCRRTAKSVNNRITTINIFCLEILSLPPVREHGGRRLSLLQQLFRGRCYQIPSTSV